MVPPAKTESPPMPKLPDDMTNSAIQKRIALTKIFKGSAPKEPATPPAPKVRIAKPR
jgi:hypothetical protein